MVIEDGDVVLDEVDIEDGDVVLDEVDIVTTVGMTIERLLLDVVDEKSLDGTVVTAIDVLSAVVTESVELAVL